MILILKSSMKRPQKNLKVVNNKCRRTVYIEKWVIMNIWYHKNLFVVLF